MGVKRIEEELSSGSKGKLFTIDLEGYPTKAAAVKLQAETIRGWLVGVSFHLVALAQLSAVRTRV